MVSSHMVEGFSKMSKEQKLDWLIDNYFEGDNQVRDVFTSFWHRDPEVRHILEGFSENVISMHALPFAVAPNFLIDGRTYSIPMVIEESSVVAAASSAAKFWQSRGGFTTKIISTTKLGHVHFTWSGTLDMLENRQADIFEFLTAEVEDLVSNMKKRGGGIRSLIFKDLTEELGDVFQLEAAFETCDSMGANFINSVLEAFGHSLEELINESEMFPEALRDADVVMCILSNYTPECLVRAEVSCPMHLLGGPINNKPAKTLAYKFKKAVDIARADTYRAVTHNKGIFNGIDALVLATGNDFRAIEACGHAYAARDGKYRSLSVCEIENEIFRFYLEIPLALGTVGGLTALHPMARLALQILDQPSAAELMRYTAVLGLAQNFAAVKSLVTTGIQQGHMRMHLQNIINHLGISIDDAKKVESHFADKKISFSAVRQFAESGFTA